MARRVYFSFHYDRDIVRVSRIRNAGILKEKSQPFLDKADWEEVKRKGYDNVKKWIDDQMKGASVLVLCIGLETYKREWVKYEIKKAHSENRGIIGIYLNGMKNFAGNYDGKGPNPLNSFYVDLDGERKYLSQMYNTYSWLDDDGYNSIEDWIEEAVELIKR